MNNLISKALNFVNTLLIFCAVSSFSFGQCSEKTELFRVSVKDKYGFIDRTGKIIIPVKYRQVDTYTGGIVRVWFDCNPQCTRRFIDRQGNFVRSQILDEGQQIEFREGLAAVSVGEGVTSKYGFIDNTGALVIDPRFGFTIGFSEGLARVMINGMDGFIDHEGQFVIPPKFEDAWDFQDGLARMKVGEKHGYIDKSGVIVIRPQFEDAGDFSNSLAPVRVGNKWGFINKQGNVVIQPKYDYVWEFNDKIAAVFVKDKWGFIDTDGTLIMKPQFEQVGDLSEDLIAVKFKGKWGYIDKVGNFVIKPKYAEARSFCNGLAYVVNLDIGSGYIDKTETYVWKDK